MYEAQLWFINVDTYYNNFSGTWFVIIYTQWLYNH